MDDKKLWNKMISQGRQAYQNELRNSFHKAKENTNEDSLGSKYSTQKQLDTVWDDFQNSKKKLLIQSL